MTREDLAGMFEPLEIPSVYSHFPNDTGRELPFICFYFSGRNDVFADNENYKQIEVWIVELYTEYKDFDVEESVETILTQHGLTYSKDEYYVDSEQMYQVTYEMEVLLNGK